MRIPSPRPEKGSALVIVVVLCGIMTLMLASYLALASSRNNFVMRSTAWNNAIPVAEAGLEEALTQIQFGLDNLTTNGWTWSGGVYRKTRTLDDGYYTVVLQPVIPPVLWSTGFVSAPLQSGYISRAVEVRTKLPGRFPFAIVAKDAITMSGGSIVDSFNSNDGPYDPSRAKANARVGTNSRTPGKFKVGTAKIFGWAGTGPGGDVTIGSSGAVGDADFVNNPANGGTIESGHSTDDMNFNITAVQQPFTSGQPPLPGLVNGTNYLYALGSGDYYNTGSMTISSDALPMIVTGHARLYVAGNFTISGSGFAWLAPGATLELYGGGGRITISGGGIANSSGVAADLSIYGMPSVTRVDYTGSAAFIGTIYAPSAALTLSGSADASGAAVANSITMSGGMNFHYDEALGGGSGVLKYVITSWKEI
jgi:hypothetical protein